MGYILHLIFYCRSRSYTAILGIFDENTSDSWKVSYGIRILDSVKSNICTVLFNNWGKNFI
jgi:hypothetical protein